jgi:hypothetical protein
LYPNQTISRFFPVRAYRSFFEQIQPVTTVMQVVRFIDPDWPVEVDAYLQRLPPKPNGSNWERRLCQTIHVIHW